MVAIKSFAKDGLEIASNFSKSNPIAMDSMLTSALIGAGVAGVGSLFTDAGLFSSALLGGAVGGVLGGAGGKHIEDLRGNFSKGKQLSMRGADKTYMKGYDTLKEIKMSALKEKHPNMSAEDLASKISDDADLKKMLSNRPYQPYYDEILSDGYKDSRFYKSMGRIAGTAGGVGALATTTLIANS